MGPVGWQEMMFIFLLALLLFGPKKLPELGRMLGRAMSEFRRAQSELKTTFEREMRNLERENESLKEITRSYNLNNSYNYNYDYSSYDSGPYGDNSANGSPDSTVTNTSTASASATEGAESISVKPAEGTVAHGTEAAANGAAPEYGSESHPEAAPVAGGASNEHKA